MSQKDLITMELRSDEFREHLRVMFAKDNHGEYLEDEAIEEVIQVLSGFCAKGTREKPFRPFAARVH